MAVTPSRNIRVEDTLWHAAMTRARAEGRTITDVITTCLRDYTAGTPPADGQAPDMQEQASTRTRQVPETSA